MSQFKNISFLEMTPEIRVVNYYSAPRSRGDTEIRMVGPSFSSVGLFWVQSKILVKCWYLFINTPDPQTVFYRFAILLEFVLIFKDMFEVPKPRSDF